VTAPDTTKAPEGVRRVTVADRSGLDSIHVAGHPDAALAALLDYTSGFYKAGRDAGMPAKAIVDAMHHVESAARYLHRIALQASSSDASPVGTQKPSGFGVDHENHEALREKVETIVGDVILQASSLALSAGDTIPERVDAGLKAAPLRDPAVKEILSALQSGGEGG